MKTQLLTMIVLALAGTVAWAQQAPQMASRTPVADAGGPYRKLAPGVEITIPPDRQEADTFAAHDIIEIVQGIPGLDWNPNHASTTHTLKEMATSTNFHRDVWCLEFSFKPVRMIWVDVPGGGRKLIWYMVYRVRNTGNHMKPVANEDGSFDLVGIDRDVRFFPKFVLESHEYGKAYMDRIIPSAIAAIQQKEDSRRRLFNTVEVGSKLVPVSTDLLDRSVWGVATWQDVDPRIDTFSVSVEGLSNGYRWIDPPGAYQRGDEPGTGRVLLQKTLVLNFWRPGDEYVEDRRIIRYGIPGKVDHEWVYR